MVCGQAVRTSGCDAAEILWEPSLELTLAKTSPPYPTGAAPQANQQLIMSPYLCQVHFCCI